MAAVEPLLDSPLESLGDQGSPRSLTALTGLELATEPDGELATETKDNAQDAIPMAPRDQLGHPTGQCRKRAGDKDDSLPG